MRCAFAVLLLIAVGVTDVHADHHEEGFVSIFDGKTLDGWDGNPEFWSVQDGAITGVTTKDKPTKGNTFIIWRGGTVDDFELRLKFKIVGGNSGIQYRSKESPNWVIGGYQADFESGDTYSGILYEERGRGILAQRGQVTNVSAGKDKPQIDVVATIGESADINKVIKKEDWNDYKIVARGNRMMHVINGRMTCEVTDDDAAKAAKSGLLALQLHAGPPMTVQFKDIRIKPLKGVQVAGQWNFRVESDAGTGEPKFTFVQQDGKLTGDYSGMLGTQKLKGKVKGTKLQWSVSGSVNGQDIDCDYDGEVVAPGKMKGTVVFNGQYEATWTASRAAD